MFPTTIIAGLFFWNKDEKETKGINPFFPPSSIERRWLCFSVIVFKNIKSHTWAQIIHKCDVNRPVKDLFGGNGMRCFLWARQKQSKSPWLASQWPNRRFNSSLMVDTNLSIVVKGVKEDSDSIPLVGRPVHRPVEALSSGEPHSLLDKVLLSVFVKLTRYDTPPKTTSCAPNSE